MKPNAGDVVLLVMLICFLLFGIFTINDFLTKRKQEKYGLAYNPVRVGLGIPVIRPDWRIRQRDEDCIYWANNERQHGHKRKSVMFSGSNIYGELDVYNLTPQNGESRLLQTIYIYRTRQHPDSLTCTYQVGHYANAVSKAFADSILKSDGITKN